jgi:hypothetical protein
MTSSSPASDILSAHSICRDERLREGRLHTGCMTEPDAPKVGWLSSFPAGPPDKEGLARIVDADGGRDDAENLYYEEAADPGFVRMEKARRRFRGQYLRRLRRLAARARAARS